MIQDINDFYNVDFKDIVFNDEDYILFFKDNKIALKNNRLPKIKEVNAKDIHYIYFIGNIKYFIAFEMEGNYEYVDMQTIRTHNDQIERFAIITGRHLNEWYLNNIYCGKCGKETFYDIKERAKRCECGNIIYPRINPAVIVAVLNDDKILLTKYAKGFSKYALIAGFTEIGESFEDTVKREVLEEVGLKVKNIRYFKSQPWGLSGSILAGYYCDLDGSDIPDLSSGELKEATWFKKEELDHFDTSLSLTNTMIEEFRTSKKRL